MLRKALLACGLLAACQTPRSTVQLDLSSLYTKQGATLVPTAKVPFESLLLAVVPTRADGAALLRKIEPDPETLTFETPVPVGKGFMVGLFAGALNEDGSVQRLDYMGLTPGVDFVKDETTKISISLFPAALMSFKLTLDKSVMTALQAQGIDVNQLECQVDVSRDNVGEPNLLERGTAPAFTSGVVFSTETDFIRALLRGNQAFLTGHYETGTTANCGGFGLVVAKSSFDLAQSEVRNPELLATAIVGQPTGPTGPIAQRVGFTLTLKNSGGASIVNSSEPLDQPTLFIQSVNDDGTDDSTFTGDVIVTIHKVNSSGDLILPQGIPSNELGYITFVDPVSSNVVGGTGGQRVLGVTNGAGQYRLVYDALGDPPSLTVFLSVEDATNPHAVGYGLYNISGNSFRCGNGTMTFQPDALRGFTYVEHQSIQFNGTTPLASHVFAGMLWGASPGFTDCVAEPVALPTPLNNVFGFTADVTNSGNVDTVQSNHLEITPQAQLAEYDSSQFGRLFLIQMSSLGSTLQRTFFNGITATTGASSFIDALTVPTEAYFLDLGAAPFTYLVEGPPSGLGKIDLGVVPIPGRD